MNLKDIFHIKKPTIGMIHLNPLPGSPKYTRGFNKILDSAFEDLEALINGGIDGVIVENFGDVPFYPDQVPISTITYLTRIVMEIKQKYNLPVGLNVLRNDAQAAMSIASAVELEFIRVNIHTGSMVTDQGIINGKAYETVRLRTQLQSKVQIFADVLVKHAYPLGPQLPDQAAKETYYRGLADAIIVSGIETGLPPSINHVQIIKNAIPEAPILIGSGITLSNIEDYINNADGFIIGTWLKKDNIVTNPVDHTKVDQLINQIKKYR